jgi:rhodanese-related sulfurtransferase
MSNILMTLKEFHERHPKLGSKDLILDVRNPEEYSDARIKGSINIPLPQVTQRADELKGYDHVYIHCKRGGRAQSAYQLLSSAGLDNLVCIHDAGMDQWVAEGYEVERD